MATPFVQERFVAQCAPVISSNYDTCGTVTRATIAHLNLTQIEAMFTSGGLFADLDAWFLHAMEMKACGIQRNAMYDWIMANADRTNFRNAMTGIKGVKTPSLLQPFVFGSQESVITRAYWKIVAGAAGSGIAASAGTVASLGDQSNTLLVQATATLNPNSIVGVDGTTVVAYNASTNVGGILRTVRWIRLDNRFGLPADTGLFLPNTTIHIFTKRSNGRAEHGQWKVLSSAAGTATDGAAVLDLAIYDANAGSTEPYEASPTATTKGVVIPGVNNVSDYEKWCSNRVTLDPRKRVPFWFQTRRNARCVDSEYKEVFARLMASNQAFREFGDLDLAARNRQDEMEDQKEFVNAFFFNKPSSANQTLSAWESLEPIYTPAGNGIKIGLDGKLIGRRAEFIGVKEHLRLCDRVYDLLGNRLNLFEFLDLVYNIKRARQTGMNGKKVTDIDFYTSSAFRAYFQQAYVEYAAAVWGGQARWNFDFNKVNDAGMLFDTYTFQYPSGVNVNLISDDWFDDYLDQFDNQGMITRGNLLLCLDIGKPGPNGGSIYWAQMMANRATYQSADIEQLAKFDSTFRCVLKHVGVEQTLMSETGTAVVECPLHSAWIENFAMATPVTTGKDLAGETGTGPYPNLY